MPSTFVAQPNSLKLMCRADMLASQINLSFGGVLQLFLGWCRSPVRKPGRHRNILTDRRYAASGASQRFEGLDPWHIWFVRVVRWSEQQKCVYRDIFLGKWWRRKVATKEIKLLPQYNMDYKRLMPLGYLWIKIWKAASVYEVVSSNSFSIEVEANDIFGNQSDKGTKRTLLIVENN